jgi:hypothetical protein
VARHRGTEKAVLMRYAKADQLLRPERTYFLQSSRTSAALWTYVKQ